MKKHSVGKGLNADLENFEITDIMQLITQQVKCGCLSVEGNDGNCSWSFLEGSLVDFECDFPGHLLDLKNILIKSGYLDESAYDSLTGIHDLGEKEVAELLVREKFIRPEELENINLRRLIESFIVTMQWTKGRYNFIPTSEVQKHPFLPAQDANFIILEALRQIDEMAVMKKRLQPLDRVFETTLAQANGDGSSHDLNLFKEGLEAQFDRDELETYRLFDGKRPLSEILNYNILGQFHTCRIMLDFLERGIIVPQSPSQITEKRSRPPSINRQLNGLPLALLGTALLISAFLSIRNLTSPRKGLKPTFFSAIVDNLQADRKTILAQAADLLRRP
ncbi:MAG: DUF4388 domain-containing protein [Deltaproteobacteria bacterium]|nr:DUF4388 domain-containing protein [Deltaproteobacteria bacterium]